MVQVFHPAFNSISRFTIRAAGLLIAVILTGAYTVSVSDYVTKAHVIRDQPVEFSHQHHVGGLGIDCRYCHLYAETRSYAGLPATDICMNCHAEIWKESPKLAPVRESFRTHRSIPWTRVTDLPDFVQFDHRIHVQKGVACVVCHGRMDQMPLAWREQAMTMRWCLDCHRDPEPHLVPRERVYHLDLYHSQDLAMHATLDETAVGELTEQTRQTHRTDQTQPTLIRHPTDCSACHY